MCVILDKPLVTLDNP